MNVARTAALALVWLLPASPLKNALLTRLGHPIAATAVAPTNIVWRAGRIRMAPGSRIGRLNVIKDVKAVTVGENASIGRMNLISAHPVYRRLYEHGAVLVLGDHAKITSRHSVDCSGGVTIGRYSSIAGRGTTIQTHSVDLRLDAQVAYPIVVGERSFVSSQCLLLGGCTVPPRSVLAAGAVLTRQKGAAEPGLWGGVPARRIAAIEGAWFDRATTHTRRVLEPSQGRILEDAF